MDGFFCEDGLIDESNIKHKNSGKKFWFITYDDNNYDDDLEFFDLVKSKLLHFPHLESFVFQLEIDDEGNRHAHMAISVDDKKSKPVRQFVKTFTDCIIYHINNIEAAREYCSKKYSRVEGYGPVFCGIYTEEKKKLISLGRKNRPVKYMQDTTVRKLSKMLAKHKNSEETDPDDDEGVSLLLDKIKEEKETKESKNGITKLDQEIRLLMCEAQETTKQIKKIIEETGKTKEKLLVNKLESIIESLINKDKGKVIKLARDKAEKKLLKLAKNKMPEIISKEDDSSDEIEDYTGSVYLIRHGQTSYYKIGYSNNPYKRLADIQIHNPEEVTLTTFCPGNFALERKFHIKYAKRRIRGEWFKFNDLEILEVLNKYDKVKTSE